MTNRPQVSDDAPSDVALHPPEVALAGDEGGIVDNYARKEPSGTSPAGREDRTPIYVYAIGQVEPQFPSLAVEQEYGQVVGRYDTKGMTDQQALQTVLSARENRYLARQMCWLFSVEGLPTYVVVPRDIVDFDLLTQTVRESSRSEDLEVLIGILGPLSPPEACAGAVLPMVAFDQLYSFQREELIGAIPVPENLSKTERETFGHGAVELFDRLMQIADNSGATDEHRALNYLSVRYPAVYVNAFEANKNEKSLAGVDVRPSRLSGPQSIVDVIFSFRHRRTDVLDQCFVRVDVSGEFPFIVSKLQAFYER